MLYNKDWDKTHIKADPFSLESLIAWLEKQPTQGQYSYWDNCGCMFHRYLTAMGLDVATVGGYSYTLRSAPKMFLPLGTTFEDVAAETPHTFAAALDRARKALAER